MSVRYLGANVRYAANDLRDADNVLQLRSSAPPSRGKESVGDRPCHMSMLVVVAASSIIHVVSLNGKVPRFSSSADRAVWATAGSRPPRIDARASTAGTRS